MKEKEYMTLKKKVDFKIYIFEEILGYLIDNFKFDLDIRQRLQDIFNEIEDKYIMNFEGYNENELRDYDIEEETCEFTFIFSKNK